MLLYSSNQGDTPRSEAEDMMSFLESHAAGLGSAQKRFADFEDAEDGEHNTEGANDVSPATTMASLPGQQAGSPSKNVDAKGRKSKDQSHRMNNPGSSPPRSYGSASSNGTPATGKKKMSMSSQISAGTAEPLSPKNSTRAAGLLAGSSSPDRRNLRSQAPDAPSSPTGAGSPAAYPLSGNHFNSPGSGAAAVLSSRAAAATASQRDDENLNQHLDSQPLLSTQAPPTSSPPVSPSGRRVRTYEEIEVLSRDPEKLYSARISLRQAIRALVVSEKTVEQLVEFVKLCQKLDAEIRTAWIHYTTAEARGVRDPSKQEEKLLRRFFSGLQDGSMEEYRRMRNPHRGETANEVFVGGIGVIAVPAVEAYFKRFGPLRYVDVKRDKGFGFVKFENKDIMTAVLAVEQHIIEGKRVEVKPAENRAPQKEISQKWSLAPREETKIVEVGSGGGQSPSLLSVRKLRAELADAEAGGELGMLPPPASSFPQDGRGFSSGKKGGAGKYNQQGAATTNKGGKGWKQGGKGYGGAAAGKGGDKGQQHQGKEDYYSKEKYPVGSHFEHFHARGGGKIGAKGQPLERSAKGGGRGNDYNFGASDDYTYPAQTANYGSGSSYNSKSGGKKGSRGSSGSQGQQQAQAAYGGAAQQLQPTAQSAAGVDPFAAAPGQPATQIMYDRSTGQLVQVITQPMGQIPGGYLGAAAAGNAAAAQFNLNAAAAQLQYGALTAMYPGTIGVAQANAGSLATMPHLQLDPATLNASLAASGQLATTGGVMSVPASRSSRGMAGGEMKSLPGSQTVQAQGPYPQSAPGGYYSDGVMPYYDATTGSYAFLRVAGGKDEFRDSLVLPEYTEAAEYTSKNARGYSSQQIQ
mmetsp:Transcript_24728/g.62173  ORF Transcript_24728/g.62173 Transcript_24728/m.62173 type:complete len:861 (+) Transcript_24728:1428-4010(+)|eukprot:CAMPEP_0178988530 /NCGR_PEP_ID=MMETSP0795-20121207/3858_1 /TAXON_ID=88552 /ORGANISM="Amoebophrya sp., Strain Ameob2" /LENGTH=860 /DNA_ID=CAMNT_0020679807 /DNA_START=1426 /DNA_END=4008 /DNA_ORIENTATION=-